MPRSAISPRRLPPRVFRAPICRAPFPRRFDVLADTPADAAFLPFRLYLIYRATPATAEEMPERFICRATIWREAARAAQTTFDALRHYAAAADVITLGAA